MLHRLLDGTRFGVHDDFTGIDVDSRTWDLIATDNGAWGLGAGLNGMLLLNPSDDTVADNDEVYVFSAENHLLKAGKSLYAAARLQFVEAAADQANVIFGFMSGVAADALRDDGTGPRTSGTVCCWYKRDRDTTWHVQSRDYFDFEDTHTGIAAGSVTRTETIDGVVTSTTPWEFLEIFIDDPTPPYQVRDRVLVATFRYNGVLLPIRHEMSIVNASEMSLFAGVKNGAATAELLALDVLHADQVRD